MHFVLSLNLLLGLGFVDELYLVTGHCVQHITPIILLLFLNKQIQLFDKDNQKCAMAFMPQESKEKLTI